MAVTYIRSRLTRKTIYKNVRELSGILGGNAPDPHSFRALFWGRVAHHLFSKVYTAYEIKSEGGRDELGNRWKPLSPVTIARRPLRRGDVSRYGLGGRGERAYKRRVRGLLTPSQDRQWRAIFASKLVKFAPVMGQAAAREEAAKIAWNILKARGAQTLVDALGHRDVLILRVTDTLYASYRPGTIRGKNYIPSPNQLYSLDGKQFRIGSLVPYAKNVSKDRPIWPPNMDRWIDEALDIATLALQEEIARTLQ